MGYKSLRAGLLKIVLESNRSLRYHSMGYIAENQRSTITHKR